MKTKREAIIFLIAGILITFLATMLFIRSNGEIAWAGFQGLGIGSIIGSIFYLVRKRDAS